MMNVGALANIDKEAMNQNMQNISMTDMGYPTNLAEEDKVFIIQRMMELANEPNNPYLSGDSGMKMLLMEKYGVGN